MLGVRRIDRYVIREVAGPIALGFSLFSFLLLMNAFFVVAQKTISSNLGWDLALRMFALRMPPLFVLTIPMAILLGCLVGIGRLSADHEWVALQGSGSGPSVLFRPLLLVGLLSTLICLGLYWEVVPRSNFAERGLRGEVVLASNTAADLRPRTFYSQLDDIVLYINDIRPGQLDGMLDGVFVHRTDRENDVEELILARQGRIRPVADGSGDLRIEMWDATAYRIETDDPREYSIQRFAEQTRTHPAPAFVRAFQAPPDESVYDMDTVALIEEVDAARTEADPQIRSIRVRTAELELHMRLALPTACLLFAILALPLGVTRARSGKGAGFALSIGVFLVYYVVFIATRNLAYDGVLPPWVGAWSANAILVPWFVFGYRRLRLPGAEERGLIPRLRMLASRALHALRQISPARAENPELDAEQESHPEALPHRHGGVASRAIARLDAYVGRQYLRVFVMTLAACYLLYVIIELRSLVGDFVKSGEPAATLLRYFAYFSPGMLPYALPVACMTGGIVTVTILARSGELTAIKASGISVRRASLPLVAVTAMLCGGYFLVQDRIAPEANQKRDELRDRLENRTPRTYGLPPGGGWVFGADGTRLYRYSMYDESRGQFQDLDVLTLDRDELRFRDHRHAARATWRDGSWILTDTWYRTLPRSSGDPTTYEESEAFALADMDPPEHFRSSAETLEHRSRVADQMSSRELRERIAGLRQSGYDATRLEVAYFAKFSQALTPLVMLLLGLPFAFRVGRRGSLYGIGVAILLIIVYWATLATFQALGLETILPPVLAAWAPNVLYGFLGGYLLLYVRT